MALAPQLLKVLACPEDKGPLYYLETEDILFNPRLDRIYRVDTGIPVMLVEEATAADEAEAERINGLIESEGITPTFNVD